MLPSTVLLNLFAPILQFKAELPHLYLNTRALQHDFTFINADHHPVRFSQCSSLLRLEHKPCP